MALQAGRLDRRVTLERFVTAPDAYNEPVKSWGVLAVRKASCQPLSDGERFRAGETAAGATARFVIRWSTAVSDLNPKDRLRFEGGVHEILHVKEIGRREAIEITTAARAD